MADSFSLPWWLVVLAYGAEIAPVIVPLAAVAAVLYFCFGRRQIFRVALFATGVPAIVSLCGATYFYGERALGDHQRAAFERQHTRLLTAPLHVGPARIPAGVSLTKEPYEKDAFTVHAPATGVSLGPGVVVKGDVNVESDGIDDENATLARDGVIDGVPCAAGPVRFVSNRLTRCTLAGELRLGGIVFEPGTLDEPGDGIYYTTLTIGSKPPSLRVAGHVLPPGASVNFNFDGLSDHHMTILIRREPFSLHRGPDRCKPFPRNVIYDTVTRVASPSWHSPCTLSPDAVTLR
jgi:hypothetical protein